MTTLTADRIEDWLLARVIKPTAIAFAWVVVALLWTFLLQHVIAYPFVFLFFGAVMGSVWFGGMIAGGIAVLFSSLLIGYFFIPPLYSMTIAKESQSFFAAFILCAIAITIVGSAKKRAEDAIREARDQLEEKVLARTADLERSNLEIQESERQLRQLTEAIPQQIWRTAADGKVEYCNRPLIEYLCKPASDLQGDAFWDVLHPEDRALFLQGTVDCPIFCAGGRVSVAQLSLSSDSRRRLGCGEVGYAQRFPLLHTPSGLPTTPPALVACNPARSEGEPY